jgi:hypothetical protein
MSNEINLKDQLSSLPTLIGNENYPMWSHRISAFFKHCDLHKTVNTNPGETPSSTVKRQQSKAANILLTKISDKLYNRIITDLNDNVGYLIWTRIRSLRQAHWSLPQQVPHSMASYQVPRKPERLPGSG